MKFLRYILFLLFVVMLTPNTMVAQNVGERQVPCDSSVVGRSLRQSGELQADVLLVVDGKISLDRMGGRIELADNSDKVNIECQYYVSKLIVDDPSSIEVLNALSDTAFLLVTIDYYYPNEPVKQYQFYMYKSELYDSYVIIGIINGRKGTYEVGKTLGWKVYKSWLSKKMKINRKIFTNY